MLWQQISVGVVLGAAVAYLIWRQVQGARRRRQAGLACSHCALAQSASQPPSDQVAR